MKKAMFSALAVLSVCAATAQEEAKVAKPCRPNQMYFGPELIGVRVDTHVKDIHAGKYGALGGVRIGDEYLKPWSFYAGVDVVSAVASEAFHAAKDGAPIHSDSWSGFTSADLRLGYSMSVKDMTFTPFLGTGALALGDINRHRGFFEGWAYASAGLRSMFRINDAFAIGFNLKATKAYIALEQFKSYTASASEHSLPWGGEVGLPLVWNFSSSGTWTFQLEPYWNRLDLSQKQTVLWLQISDRSPFLVLFFCATTGREQSRSVFLFTLKFLLATLNSFLQRLLCEPIAKLQHVVKTPF